MTFPQFPMQYLRELSIFDVDTVQSGRIRLWRQGSTEDQSRVTNLMARDATLNGCLSYAKTLGEKNMAEAPQVLFASKSASIEQLIRSWENDCNDGVRLSAAQRGSGKLYRKLQDALFWDSRGCFSHGMQFSACDGTSY